MRANLKRKAVESLDNVPITSQLAKWEAAAKPSTELKNVPGRIVWPFLEPYLGRSSCVNALIPRLPRRPYPTEEPSWKDSLAANSLWKDSLAAGISFISLHQLRGPNKLLSRDFDNVPMRRH
jgi:hypothetical protein